MTLLDNDAFLTNLTRILEKSRGKGSVQITMKRCAPPALRTAQLRPQLSHDAPCPAAVQISASTFAHADAGKEGKTNNEVDPADCKCLIRAIGNKKKISAMVSAKDYLKFMQSYGNILKISLDSLKKKEKKKAMKGKTEKKATD